MIKPSMPSMPGFGAMTDTMDFVKNMWGGMSTPGMGIPGMVMPTLSVEDIDKQIKDLKAVESWLNVNMTMLRGTIQALEVQSATISTLKSMGESLTAGVRQATSSPAASATVASNPASFAFGFPATAAATAAAAKSASESPVSEPMAKSSAAGSSAGADKKTADAGTGAQADTPYPTPLPNPAIWWNMLQDQFKQAVNTAMAAEPAAPAKTTAKNDGSTSSAAPRKRKASPK